MKSAATNTAESAQRQGTERIAVIVDGREQHGSSSSTDQSSKRVNEVAVTLPLRLTSRDHVPEWQDDSGEPAMPQHSKETAKASCASPQTVIIRDEFTARLRSACAYLGTTPEKLSDRDVNAWCPLLVEVTCAVGISGLALVMYILCSNGQLMFVVPGAAFIVIVLPTPFIFLRRSLAEINRHWLSWSVLWLCYLPVGVWLVLGGAVVDDLHAPFQSKVLYLTFLTPLIFMMYLRSIYLLPQTAVPRDQPRLTTFAQVASATSVIIDAVSDLALAAGIFRAMRIRACKWGARTRCDMYALSFGLIMPASGLQFALFLLLTLWPHGRKSNRIFVPLTSISMVAEVVKFAMTLQLATHVGRDAGATPGQLDPVFVVASGVISLVTFFHTLFGMRRLTQFVRDLASSRRGRSVWPERQRAAGAALDYARSSNNNAHACAFVADDAAEAAGSGKEPGGSLTQNGQNL